LFVKFESFISCYFT